MDLNETNGGTIDLTQLNDHELLQLLESENDLTPELRELLEEYPNDLPYAVGEKCAIPFQYKSYTVLLPAIILGYNDNSSQQYAQVLILIPITTETIPCPKQLERGTNDCNHGEHCPYLHDGYTVPADFLLPFEILEQENMLEQLQYGRKVWCKEDRNETTAWQLGKIIDQTYGPRWRVHRSMRKVRKRTISVDIEHILPFKTLEGNDENDIEDDTEDPAIFKTPTIVSDEFGSWQAHTTGFATKMMEKMGYVAGQGLGASGEGRVEPIQAKPYGKIRFLKGGDQSRPGLGLNHTKENEERGKAKRNKQKKAKQQQAKEKEKAEDETDMFTFMNTLLKEDETKAVKPKAETTAERKAKTPKDAREANQMIAKISSDVDKAQYNYVHANEAYRRNKGTPFETQFHTKLKAATQTLQALKKQKADLERHAKATKAKKDMYTF
ncbi:hypothetical protein BDF20DRAFT_818623 [Mycotypha africana]|uniref:uncharacterized protein n=1 Tax=Mycotypha africana TaxID=64632 RepID=UPI0023007545|nr:uncharacterized protein BDF20DRAFT_818623 [Mycotypha africana]KAI8981990.1 hypothetical protein BDF20DRAFT_818623 [Mycotypha africana]